MKRLLLSLLITLALPIPPILSHGNNGHCLEKCNDYYCPPEHQLEKKEKEKVKNNIPSKK
ncbi:hypothetical protein [Prochlorococcus marinus]|uniref:hypothetical protein n=1 Tax=Prochlorococcus marinus TaxID=1219 RepID=UPI000190048F|nr:hypothetical protein [Prochlorococcus marinus]EEE40600.1 conserved hypothetical protein [Prochlorococcus marinus str. MIT 9202]